MYQLDSATLAVTAEPIEDWVGKYILGEDLPHVRAAVMEADGVHCTIALPVSERQVAREMSDA